MPIWREDKHTTDAARDKHPLGPLRFFFRSSTRLPMTDAPTLLFLDLRLVLLVRHTPHAHSHSHARPLRAETSSLGRPPFTYLLRYYAASTPLAQRTTAAAKKDETQQPAPPARDKCPFVFRALSEYDTPANTATIFNPAALFQEEYPAAEKYLWALLRVSDTHHAVVNHTNCVKYTGLTSGRAARPR